MTHSDEVHAFKPAEAWEVDSESADSDPDQEPGLNVRLLKVRGRERRARCARQRA